MKDVTCLHPDFHANVTVNRIADDPSTPPTAFMADITIRCSWCQERFYWPGMLAGLDYNRPMVSANGFQLRAPIRPESTDRNTIVHGGGFTIEVYQKLYEDPT